MDLSSHIASSHLGQTPWNLKCDIGQTKLIDCSKGLFVLSRLMGIVSVGVKAILAVERLGTDWTFVRETIGKMLGLDMVSGTTRTRVRENITNCTVKLSILLIFGHKLHQLTRIGHHKT